VIAAILLLTMVAAPACSDSWGPTVTCRIPGTGGESQGCRELSQLQVIDERPTFGMPIQVPKEAEWLVVFATWPVVDAQSTSGPSDYAAAWFYRLERG
jgi:hypothetical protein